MPWSRPPDVPVGRVWRRFYRSDKNGFPSKRYQIKDMEPSERKLCLDMMERVFLRDEPLCQILAPFNPEHGNVCTELFGGRNRSCDDTHLDDLRQQKSTSNVEADAESVATIRSNWERYADHGICVTCYTEEEGAPQDLVGFNILVVKTADDEDEDIERVAGEPWKKLLRTLLTAEKLVNVYELYSVDKYLTSSGLVVMRPYRGQNIGAEIIAVRETICKTFGIEATATVFTAKGSQMLAAKCGFQQLAVLPYEDMLEQGVYLTGCSAPSAVLMGRKFNIKMHNSL